MSELAVIIPYFNAEKTLPKVLDGLAKATYKPDIFLADDASNKSPADIIQNYQKMLNITLISRSHNGGQAAAINSCLKQILNLDYPFIAINDADDVSHPERFAKQIAFMQTHNLDLCGTYAAIIHPDTQAKRYTLIHPDKHENILKGMFYNSCFVHPSVMFKRHVFEKTGLYNEQYRSAADYELFTRICRQGSLKVGNLPEELVDYYIGTQNTSVKKRQQQTLNRLKTQLRFFRPLNVHAYLGVGRTLMALLLPASLLFYLKSKFKRSSFFS